MIAEHVAFGLQCPRRLDDPPTYCVPCYEQTVRRAAFAWAILTISR